MKIIEIYGYCLLAGHAFIFAVAAGGLAIERCLESGDRRWRERLGNPPK